MRKTRKPGIALLLARVILMAGLAAVLSFAIALFVGIAGVMLVNFIRGSGTSLTFAYRYVALPVAVVAFGIAFIASLTFEIRYRRAKLQETSSKQQAPSFKPTRNARAAS